MPDEELTLILKLRDEATKGLKSWRTQVVAAGAACCRGRIQGRG